MKKKPTTTRPLTGKEEAKMAAPTDIRKLVVAPSEKDIDLIVPDQSIYE